ncbi:single-stranded DNA-binding protein (plasmid) [Clostridium perfringens]|uniref:single-stranded DNA-binding protein n=1 Tax=Clostridium perfringens TaxID=1502 RepID=UPI000B387AC3|nr:single-stranded DNA-binding protein [Clostridium perfringens]EGT0690622.1 single-stranded DNA-binding protein [Clostridium perfringens]EGT0694085.1 single-stranded DNA-binding protein [Clostridium perfringens]EGT0697050.1 single-stranded DNA-binding protein [Clostridium perfringens]MDU3376255.1 single-stranded DNA-binding protein [Clostridium perfringens]MDU3534211.1 single-stranded DNA-binding protein [Clostridium perfringens]
MINTIVLSGHIANDGELFVKEDTAIYSNSIAFTEIYKGEERPVFIKFKCFDNLARHLDKHLKKGFKVTLQGCLSVNIYQKNGVNVTEPLIKVIHLDIHSKFSTEKEEVEVKKEVSHKDTNSDVSTSKGNNPFMGFGNSSIDNNSSNETELSHDVAMDDNPDMTLIPNDDAPFGADESKTEENNEVIDNDNPFLSMFKS